MTIKLRKAEALSFGQGNAKFGGETMSFSLSAGWSCPGARECLAKVDMTTGKLSDGKDTQFRCFAASMEARMPSVRKSRERNYKMLLHCKSEEEMTELILGSLDEGATRVRVHVSGDFFSAAYFRAWMGVARQRPNTLFYAYTKSLKYWVENLGLVPANFKLNASKGGRWDHLIVEHSLKYAEVVFCVEQASKLGLAIDNDDSLAYGQDSPFALLLHGTQPKGSVAAKALSALKALGHTGYSSKREVASV